MTVRVSVILPVYNRSRTIVSACSSVLNQPFRDLELIVVDDGSNEDIQALVRAIGDERVKYIRRPVNGGAAAARNTGLVEARGDFIAFQDSDDLWLPDKLQRQLDLFSDLPPNVGVVTGAKIIYGRDDRFNYGPGRVALAPSPFSRLRLDEDQLGHLFRENRVSVQNALFRRDCFPGRAWFDSNARANEDWDFAIRLAQYTTIYEDPEPVVLAFVSNDSISANFRKESLGTLRILKKHRKKLLIEYPEQHASILFSVSRFLFRSNRTKSGIKFLFASIWTNPGAIFWISRTVVKKAGTAIFNAISQISFLRGNAPR